MYLDEFYHPLHYNFPTLLHTQQVLTANKLLPSEPTLGSVFDDAVLAI